MKVPQSFHLSIEPPQPSVLVSRDIGRLPGGLLQDSARRLGLMSLISVVTGLSFFILAWILNLWQAQHAAFVFTIFPCFLVLSMAVFFVSRSRRLRPETILDIGLVYKMLAAACLALLVNRQPWPMTVTLPSWSPIAVWVLIFSLIVPDSPRRTLWTSAVAAATDPLAVFLLAGMGLITRPPIAVLVHRFLPNLIAVLVGYVVARIIAHIGRRLAKARRLGRYQLGELIGKGGMGEVWRAEHRMLARAAAIKLIRPDFLGGQDSGRAQQTLRRFEREARATANLRSPHTIVVYDCGIARDGTFYYVMELLDGLDLRSFVERFGPQPANRVVFLLRQACHSLREAHQMGLVHRDIKPANLFVCRYGAEVDFLKILDFGLVKERTREGLQDALATRPGEPSGTPAFMAPELILGEGPIDGRADIYALGCVAYWLLTGTHVFDSSSAMKVMVQHVKDTPDPPSRRTEIPVPRRLEKIVMSCLEKDPARRPRTAATLAEQLDCCEEARSWTSARAVEWWATHLPAASAAATTPTRILEDQS